MKKTVFGFIAATALTMSLASCGEKLLTPEQMTAKIEEGFNAQQATLEAAANAKCDADFETRVTAEVDRLKAEATAAAEAAKAEAKAAEEALKAASKSKKK